MNHDLRKTDSLLQNRLKLACASTPCFKQSLWPTTLASRASPTSASTAHYSNLAACLTLCNIGFGERHRKKNLLGEVYEHFLGQFVSVKVNSGHQLYTTSSLKAMVEVLAAHQDRGAVTA